VLLKRFCGGTTATERLLLILKSSSRRILAKATDDRNPEVKVILNSDTM
jgi:hypothetical protein